MTCSALCKKSLQNRVLGCQVSEGNTNDPCLQLFGFTNQPRPRFVLGGYRSHSCFESVLNLKFFNLLHLKKKRPEEEFIVFKSCYSNHESCPNERNHPQRSLPCIFPGPSLQGSLRKCHQRAVNFSP